ncbi:hypothetical protein FGG78_17545 [Thioclava sp. BHET1]|nr:hypothetical protein FGG78_17545 [Thioclava sp. BHET1]
MGDTSENRRVISFQEAVDFAYEALEEVGSIPDEVDRLTAFVLYFCEKDDQASLGSVIRAAETQALSFDALSRAAGLLLERGHPLPPALAGWTSQRLAEKITRPKIPVRFNRGWPGENRELERIIYDLVATLRDLGITPTRNDSKGNQGFSGCDAVAEAMAKRKLTPNTFRGIKAIYIRLNGEYRAGRLPAIDVAVTSAMVKDMLRK